MARKFIDLDEAAKMIGISPETLNEMRERQRIYGYRDGGNWKFKPEDVEKLIADREAVEQEGEFAELDEDPDSILLSEVELGSSGESTSSTIIGGKSSRNLADSDIQLAPAKDNEEIDLSPPKHDSDLNLDSALSSDLKEGSDVLQGGSGLSPMFDELDTLDLEMDSAADSGIFSTPAAGTDSSLDLGAESGGSAIALGSDALKLEGSQLGMGDSENLGLGEASDLEIAESKAGGSAIDLTGDEDGDLVLGGSSHGDLSRTGDSGISLLDPADSGLSLESPPLELGGSAVESLELGEDDMILVDEPTASSKASAAASGIAPQTDDDFLLSPLEETAAEESDSGSQVIALVDESEFDSATAGASTITTDAPQPGLSGLLEDDFGEALSGGSSAAPLAAALTPAAMQATGPAAGGAGAPAITIPEAVFSGWNVASLVMCAVVLMLLGMFMFDLLRNMWSWNAPYKVNSTLMDMVLSWF